MSEAANTREPESAQRLNDVRLRLVKAAEELEVRPVVTGSTELFERVESLARELRSITTELLLVLHLERAEERGLETRLVEIDRRLAAGWEGERVPVETLLERVAETH